MDVSWSELLVVGIVALVIIGPKDLPGMFRELGRFTAKIRAMGREFSRAMEQAAKETGIQDVADDLRKVTNPKSMGLDAVRSAADKFEKWDPLKPVAKPAAPLTPPSMPAAPMPSPAVAAAGPATAALASDVAAKRKASAEKTAEIARARAAPVVETIAAPPSGPAASVAEAPAPKRAGRVRKKPDASEAT
jgi:sec-independent protein translocase protein TatB